MTTLHVNQGVAQVQLQRAVNTPISGEESRAEEKREPLFHLEQTRAEKILAKLLSEGIIDEACNLKIDTSNLRIPAHQAEQLHSLKAFLEESIFIEAGASAVFYQYLVIALKNAGFIDENQTLKSYSKFYFKKKEWPYSDVYQLLCERQIIDKQGKLKIIPVEESKTQLPKLHGKSPQELLELFLNKQRINVAIGSQDVYCSIYIPRKMLLQQVCESSPKPISSLRIVGGRARKRIQSAEFCKEVFKALSRMQNRGDEGDLISEDLMHGYDGDPPDDDFRIHLPGALAQDLLKSTDNITSYFCRLLLDGNPLYDGWLRDNVFSKLNHITNGLDHYSIAVTRSAKQELIFFESLNRSQFGSDEVEEDISSHFIAGFNGPFFAGEGTMQAIICLLGNVFHIKKPSEVNHQGFFKMVSRLIQGKLIVNKDGLDTLTAQAANEDRYPDLKLPEPYASHGISGKMAFLMIDCIKEHHPVHFETAALVGLFTASGLLQKYLNQQQIGLILKLVDEAFSLSKCHPTNPVAAWLKKMVNGKIPFPIILAAIQTACFLRLGFCFPCDETKSLSVFVKAIEDKSVMQLQLKEEKKYFSLWSPFTIQSAIETLAAFMNQSSNLKEQTEHIMGLFDTVMLDSLTQNEAEPILVRYKKYRDLVSKPLKSSAESFMTGSNANCNYLGYCLLLTVGGIECDDALTYMIIKKFPEAYFFQSNPMLSKALMAQLKYLLGRTKFAPSVKILSEKFQEGKQAHSYNELIGLWSECLAETGEKEFCKISFDLWNENAHVTSSNQQEIVPKLFKLYIKQFPQYAEKLIEYTQKENQRLPFDKEMKCIGHLLFSFKNNCQQGWPSTLIKVIESFLDRQPESKISVDLIDTYASYFLWFVNHMIESSYFDIPCSLLTKAELQGLIRSNRAEVKCLWFAMAEAAFKKSEKGLLQAYEIWHQAHSLKVWRDSQSDESYLSFVCSLALKLSLNPALQNELESLLDQIAKKPIAHSSARLDAQHAVSNQIKQLIAEEHLDDASTKIQTKYKTFLTKNISIDCWIHLCRGYIKKGDFSSAMPIWDKLACLQSDEAYSNILRQLCEEILDQLAHDVTVHWNVSLLYKILMSKSIYLCSTEKQIQYLIKSLTHLNESIPFSLHSDLVQAFLERLDEVKENHLSEANTESLILIQFLKRLWNPPQPIPKAHGDLIKRLIPYFIDQLHARENNEVLFELLYQLDQHQVELQFQDKTVEICLDALQALLKTAGNDHMQVNAIIQIMTKLPIQASSKKGMELLRQLLLSSCPKKSLELLLILLHRMEVVDPNYFKACLDDASKQEDPEIACLVWKRFKQFFADFMHAGSPKEMKGCWFSALKVLAKAKHPDILSLLVQCLKPNSLFHAIAKQDTSETKHEMACILIHHCLEHLLNPAYHRFVPDVLSFRKELPDHSSASPYLLPILLKLDYELLDTLIQIDDVKIFMEVCDQFVHLLKQDDKAPVPFNSKLYLSQKVLNSGAIYERKSQNAQSVEEIVKKVDGLYKALYKYYNKDNRAGFLALYHSLANFNSPLILETLFTSLLIELTYLKNASVDSDGPSTLGMALDVALKSCCNHSNSRIRDWILQILKHKTTKGELGKKLNSFHWGNYLLAETKAHLPNSNASEKADSVFFLLSHLYLVADHPEIRERCLEQTMDLIALSMQSSDYREHSKLMIMFFLTLDGTFFPPVEDFTKNDVGHFATGSASIYMSKSDLKNGEIVLGTNFLYKFEKIYTDCNLPVCLCPDVDLKNPDVTEFRRMYYKYMTMVITKILEKNYEGIQAVFIHCFVQRHLLLLLPKFPEHAKEMAALIHLFVFWPSGLEHSRLTAVAVILLLKAFESGIYQDNPGKLMEALIYLGEFKKIPLALAQSNKLPAVHGAIELSLKIDSALSLTRAIFIFDDNFTSFSDKECAFRAFKLILQNSRKYLCCIADGTLICERLRHLIVFHKLDTKLFFILFDQLYQQYTNPTEDPHHVILYWILCQLGSVEVISYLVNCQNSETGGQYFELIEKILPDALQLLTNVRKDKESIYLIRNMITSPQFSKKSLISKKRAALFKTFIQHILDQNNQLFNECAGECLSWIDLCSCNHLKRTASPLKAKLKKVLKGAQSNV